MIAPYPTADEGTLDLEVERQMSLVIEIVRAIRNERAEHRVEPSKWIEAWVVAHEARSAIESLAYAIESLARAKPLTIADSTAPRPDKARTIVLNGAEIVLPLAGMVDIEAERQRLTREIEENQVQIVRLQTRLHDEEFLSRAPAHIVTREKERLVEYTSKMERLQQRIAELG